MVIDSLRIASSADAGEVAALVNMAYRPKPGMRGWTHEADLISGDRTTADQVAKLIAGDGSVVLLGLRAAEMVACIHIQRDGERSRIGMLAVSPPLQDMGIGKEMLSKAESFARRHFGSRKFDMLVVSARTELISFYLRRGYHRTGATVDYPPEMGNSIPEHGDIEVEVLEKLAE